MLNLTVKVTGLEEMEGKLDRFGKSMRDFKTELTVAGRLLRQFYSNEPFLSRGTVYGERWANLDPEYRVHKTKKFPAKGILEASGKMKRGMRFKSTSDYLQIYNTQDYLEYHQTGTEDMPQRIVLTIQQQQVDTVAKILAQGVAQRFNRA